MQEQPDLSAGTWLDNAFFLQQETKCASYNADKDNNRLGDQNTYANYSATKCRIAGRLFKSAGNPFHCFAPYSANFKRTATKSVAHAAVLTRNHGSFRDIRRLLDFAVVVRNVPLILYHDTFPGNAD